MANEILRQFLDREIAAAEAAGTIPAQLLAEARAAVADDANLARLEAKLSLELVDRYLRGDVPRAPAGIAPSGYGPRFREEPFWAFADPEPARWHRLGNIPVCTRDGFVTIKPKSE